MNDPRRAIPSVEKLLAAPEMQPLLAAEPRSRIVTILRGLQRDLRNGADANHDTSWYVHETAARLTALRASSLHAVINATGVVLHTNLGRAPLSEAALIAVIEAARDYTNLEYDLNSGTRGSRYVHCTQLLCELTGAESALVVNNNAAALVLALNTFAHSTRALVSRGELVEIGGSFRIPEIMERSGARLREVGATNRTHLSDYEQAVDPDVKVILKVHRSNFEMSGFVSEVEVGELADLASRHGLTLIHDLGSGLLEDLSDVGLGGEPTARQAVADAGQGIVTMSGDKLLGGPQAGIVLGSNASISQMRSNPLCRALRVDKLTIAALEATLRAYLNDTARAEIPALRMLCMPARTIEVRAHAFSTQLNAAGLRATVEPGSSAVGGGAFPGAQLPTHLVLLNAGASAQELEARLRTGRRPVITRIVMDRIAIDLRTVPEQDEPLLLKALLNAAQV
jgi:L-seryl-tRNA(Ser) seleniumtransferase